LREYLWTWSNVINGLMTKSCEHSNFVFVSTSHVRCCETEILLWMSNVNYMSDPIIYSNTQNFSTSANKNFSISILLIRDITKGALRGNFMPDWFKRKVPVSKPLLVVINQKNISDLFASLAITARPSRLVFRSSRDIHTCADRLQWLKNTPLQMKNKLSICQPRPSKAIHWILFRLDTNVLVRTPELMYRRKKWFWYFLYRQQSLSIKLQLNRSHIAFYVWYKM